MRFPYNRRSVNQILHQVYKRKDIRSCDAMITAYAVGVH